MSAVEAMGRISQIQATIRTLTQPAAQQVMGAAVLGQSPSGVPGEAGALASSSTLAAGAGAGPATSLSQSSSSADFAAQLEALTGAQGVSGAQPAAQASPGVSPSGPSGADLVAEARRYVGVPYVWGGASERGLDCSGLVKLSLSALGVDMPRVAREQMRQGAPVASLAEAEPGDLLVFGGGSHIGIYLGDGRMIDAPKPGDHVRERDVYETPSAIRRVLPTAAEVAAAAPPTPDPAVATAAQVEQLLASSAAGRSSLTGLLGEAA